MGVSKLNPVFEGKGEVKGFIFTKVHEDENGYVYEVNTGGGQCHYEAFMKKTTPICIDFENRVYSQTELKEVYPKAKDFGKWAWSAKTKEQAIQKLTQ